MTSEQLGQRINVPFTFEDRPTSLPGDMRPFWRICVVVLMLRHCRGQRATLQQLHVINWALRSSDGRRTLLEVLRGDRSPEEAIVRFDPSLSRAIDFAFGEGLIDSERVADDATKKKETFRILLTD